MSRTLQHFQVIAGRLGEDEMTRLSAIVHDQNRRGQRIRSEHIQLGSDRIQRMPFGHLVQPPTHCCVLLLVHITPERVENISKGWGYRCVHKGWRELTAIHDPNLFHPFHCFARLCSYMLRCTDHFCRHDGLVSLVSDEFGI